MNKQTKFATIAALLLSTTLFAMEDTEAVTEAPRAKVSFAEQMKAKRAAAATLQAQQQAQQQAQLLSAGKKTLAEFEADAVDGKVGNHFVVPHAGRQIIDATTHRAIPVGHTSFDPTTTPHISQADSDEAVRVVTEEKAKAERQLRLSNGLLEVIKGNFAGDIGTGMEAALPNLCAGLKVGTDVEATDDEDLTNALMLADGAADTLVNKFLAAHGTIAENSEEARTVKYFVELLKFFTA